MVYCEETVIDFIRTIGGAFAEYGGGGGGGGGYCHSFVTQLFKLLFKGFRNVWQVYSY
jgi:hypothetical protein